MKSKKDTDLEYYVVKSNELIRHSRYSLTVQQQRIVLYAISKIRPEDSINTWYEFSIQDICRACGIADDNGYYYTSIKEDLRKLMHREFGVLPDGAEASISWIGDVKMYQDNGVVQICFNPNMQPFLFELKERYTQYKLENVLAFKNASTIRLYELLRSYVTQRMLENNIPTTKELTVEELKKRLDMTGTYQEWCDFERYVIRKSVDEINKTNDEMHVTYESKKLGRRVNSVIFTISAPSSKDMWDAYGERKKRLKQIGK